MTLPKVRRAALVLVTMVVLLGLNVATAAAYTRPADDDIPGVALPASPFTGSLLDTQAIGPSGPLWDVDDVYAVPLVRNQMFEATMTPAPQANFDLVLFSYLTKSLTTGWATPSLFCTWSDKDVPGAVEHITFVSERSTVATYYLDVASMYEASGDYTLEWAKTSLPTPSIEITGPATTSGYGVAATICGTATVDPNGSLIQRPIAGFTVYVLARPAGSSTWTKIVTTKTTTSGAFAATVRPTKTTAYCVKTPWGYSKEDSSPIGYGASTAVYVSPKAYLAFGTTPKYAYAGKTFAVSGVIKPSHGYTTRHIKVSAYRYSTALGRFVFYKYYWMKGSGTSWSGKFSLPKGRWRLSLSCAADSLHTSSYGTGFRYFTVK